jgi:hypothetical protein
LNIEWPVAEGTLELIEFNQTPVQSLWLLDRGDDIADWSLFPFLNFSSLRLLHLDEILDQDIEELFDIVLESDPKDITLISENGLVDSTYKFLTHPLIGRVVDLNLSIGQLALLYNPHAHLCSVYDIGDLEFHSPGSIKTFPSQIKSWTLSGPGETLSFFDLDGAKELYFTCIGPSDNFRMAFIPSHLTVLILRSLDRNPDTFSEHGPNLMPELIELRLISLKFEGRFQDYIECPKLKKLYLDGVRFFAPVRGETEDDITLVEKTLSYSISFSSLPEFQRLYFRRGYIDGKIVSALQSCPLLQHISSDWCYVEEFVPTFTTAIADSKSFPVLNSLFINNSWRDEEPWSRKEFVQYCISQRPGLTVSSNDMGLGVLSQMA